MTIQWSIISMTCGVTVPDPQNMIGKSSIARTVLELHHHTRRCESAYNVSGACTERETHRMECMRTGLQLL